MLNISNAFRRTLHNGERNYLPYIDITLKDGTKLPQFTEDTLWTSGLSMEAAVSEDDRFTAIGAAVMGTATVILDNRGEKWNEYDFIDAEVNIKVGLSVNGTPEILQKGKYTVESATYNAATVTLSLQDYMHQFDRVYDTEYNYPSPIGEIMQDCCLKCGVSFKSVDFPHSDYIAQAKPSDQNTTYRDIIAWIAQIAGCYARFDVNGKLVFEWFGEDQLLAAQEGTDGGEFDSAKPYATGDTADGGVFNPWNIGTELDGGDFATAVNCHYVGPLFSESISLDSTVITGVTVAVEYEEDNQRLTASYTKGTADYLISLEGNKLINYMDVEDVCTWLGNKVIGLTFRKCKVTHLSDPSMEAGDVGLLYDHRNREYPILISRTKFTCGKLQETVCGSETPARNRATQFSASTKNYVDLRRQLNKSITMWDQKEQELRDAIDSSTGLYETDVVQQDGSTKKYYHDQVLLAESDIVMTFNSYGFEMTDNYQDGANATWYGMAVTGDMVAELLTAKKVSTLTLEGGVLKDPDNNTLINMTEGKFTIKKGSITLGDMSDTSDTSKYYFNANTEGHISWNEQYSSLSAAGKLTAKDATLQGTLLTGSESSTACKISGGVVTYTYNGEEIITQKGQAYNTSDWHGCMIRMEDECDFWGVGDWYKGRGRTFGTGPCFMVVNNSATVGEYNAKFWQRGIYCAIDLHVGAMGHRLTTLDNSNTDFGAASLYIEDQADIRLGMPDDYTSGYTGTINGITFKKGICTGAA